MTLKKLMGMAVVLVLMAGAAIWQRSGQARPHRAPRSAAATLLKGVDLNALTGLEVSQTSNRVALVKKEGVWTVDSLYGYPADFGKLAEALRKLAEVKTGRPVRAGNVADSEFGLDEGGRKIVLNDGDGAPAAMIAVGARRDASSGWAGEFFIRLDGRKEIYLVDYDFGPFSDKPADWIGTELLKVPSADVVSVKAGDASLALNGRDWTLTDLNPETEEFQRSEANRLRSALNNLRCVTVADPAKSDADLGLDDPFVYVAQTKGGLVFTVKLGAETDDGRVAHFSVDYIRPEPPVAPADDDNAGQEAYGKELDEFNNLAAAYAGRADELNAQFSKWTYFISSYAAESLTLSRDELVKAKEDEPVSTDTP
jgi:hypothetical protein